jgi:hypothetical protein
MLTCYHIRLIIEKCRELGAIGLDNGVSALIPQLQIDFLSPPNDFLGVQGNPAIFVNQYTYNLIGHLHSDWIVNRTIALKSGLLSRKTIDVIGSIIHETGHAFNVAAKISNTEANAYIYEIEVMLMLFETKSPLLFDCAYRDVQFYFKQRLSEYNKGAKTNQYLADLITTIKEQFNLKDEKVLLPQPKSTKSISFFVKKETIFEDHHWSRETAIVLSKMTVSY